MAIRTKPLISAAALASAATVAVSTQAVASTRSLPTPLALSTAQVQLTTFSDLLSITPEDWSNILFTGWGFALSPNQPLDIDWAAGFISPFTNCDFNCAVTGPSGVAYAALDALINGNGAGIDTVNGILQDPSKPYQPDPDKPDFNPYTTPPWGISSVNYFFEGGAGSGVQYLVTQPFGDPASPLYNPEIATLIGRAFLGVDNVSVTYIQALDLISKLAIDNVPFLGSYIYGGIQAYLGPNTSDEFFGDWGYFAGLSGLLRYATDVILTGGNPFPPYGPPTATDPAETALASAAVPATEAVSLTESTAVDQSAEAADVTDAASAEASEASVDAAAAPSDIEGDIAAVDTAEAQTTAEIAAVDTTAVDTTAVETATDIVEVQTAPDVAPVETTPDITPVEVPAEVDDAATSVPAADVADSAPAGAATKTPGRAARGAMERAAKSIASAVGGSKAAKSTTAGAAASGADSTAGSSKAGSSKDSGSKDSGSKDSSD